MKLQDRKDVMSEKEFTLLRDLIHNEFGIWLKGDKRLTLHTKVSHRLSILGLATYHQYYEYLLSDVSKAELYTLASHIANNETYFFRDKNQLDMFSELLPDIKRIKQEMNENKLTVVSLASSSGEEAYTLNILVHESGLFVWDWDVKVIGIDVDRNAIQKAKDACYTNNSFRSTNGNAAYVDKYFYVENGRCVLRPSLTKNVEFILGNILDRGTFDGITPIDVIFCRNVLMYMSDGAIGKLARNFYDLLSDSGYLFIGSSESLIQKTNLFLPEYKNGTIVYKKNLNA